MASPLAPLRRSLRRLGALLFPRRSSRPPANAAPGSRGEAGVDAPGEEPRAFPFPDLLASIRLAWWEYHVPSRTVRSSPLKYTMLGLPPEEGFRPLEEWLARIHPDERSEAEGVMRRLLADEGERYEMLYRLEGAGGGWVWCLDRGSIVRRDREGRPVTVAGVVEPVSERMDRAEDRRIAVDAGEELAELAEALVGLEDVDEISLRALRTAQRITGSEHGFVGYLDPEDESLVCPTFTDAIWSTCQVEDKTFRFEEWKGLWGWVLREHRPLLSNDPAGDPRAGGVPHGHISIRRFLAAPATAGERLSGIVALANSDRDYEGDDLLVVERIAALYTLAVERGLARAEVVRRQSELTKILDAIPDSVVVAHREGEFRLLQRDSSRVLGLEPLGEDEHEIRFRMGEKVPAHVRELLEQRGRAAFASGELQRVEYTLPEGEGRQRHREARIRKLDEEQLLVVLRDITERVRMEQELQRSEQLLRETLDTMVEGALLLDREWRYLYANDAAMQHTPYTASDVLGKPLLELLPGFQKHPIFDLFRRAMEQREEVREVHAFTSSLGIRRIYDVAAHPVGEGIFVLLYDITERVQAEQALRESEEKYRALAEHTPDILARFDSQGRLLHVNSMLERYYEIRREELYGLTLPEMGFLGEGRSRLDEVLREVLASGQTRELETDFETTRGVRHVLVAFTPEFGESEQLRFVTITARDDTERSRARAALRASEARSRALLSGLPDLVFRMDADGTYLDLHTPDPALLAAPPDAIIGTRVGDHGEPEEFVAEARRLLALSVETGKQQRLEYALPTPAGVRQFEARMVPSLDREIIVVAQDITERKRMEEALAAQSRLEATATLAGGLAHDINNLMAIVLGNADLLADEHEKESEERHMVEEVAGAAQRTSELIGQLLAFAREGRYQSERLDLPLLVTQVVHSLEERNPGRVVVRSEAREDLPAVAGDPTQVRQLLHNLLQNSYDALEGEGEIVVRCEEVALQRNSLPEAITARPGTYVLITVEDNGPGMEEETVRRAFEPFFTTRFLGRGLGLAAAYGIVKAHGGYIVIESEPGSGARVRTWLPAATDEEQARPAPSRAAPGGGETILLMDDDEALRRALVRSLASLGYTVLQAADCDQAVVLLKQSDSRPDLLLLDLSLAHLRSEHFCNELNELAPEIPLLLITGSNIPPGSPSPLLERAHGLLTKPVRRDELGRAVRAALADEPI